MYSVHCTVYTLYSVYCHCSTHYVHLEVVRAAHDEAVILSPEAAALHGAGVVVAGVVELGEDGRALHPEVGELGTVELDITLYTLNTTH